MGKRRPPASPPHSAARVAELEAAIAYLVERQNAKAKADVHGRMILALLIQAFERTLERARHADGLDG